ncbi:hypothetical protein HDU84_002610 [Entophlyctis sp. JEL0112]|nr:hypothetical protein HDU84_002610 [Entophlyctis sp. JEL0112]
MGIWAVLALAVAPLLASAFGVSCALDRSEEVISVLRGERVVDLDLTSPSCTSNCLPHLPPLRPSTLNSSSKPKLLSAKRRPAHDDGDLKVAFVGDFGLGKKPEKVLKMIDDWGAELTVMLGDFDYVDSPDAFIDMIESEVGKNFPFVGVAGNHDVLEWYGRGGYRDRLLEKLDNISGMKCFGEYGANMVFALSGVGTIGRNHAEFLDLSLSKYANSSWKVCSWHKNQAALQTGDKENETGYEVYETCRSHGAIVITAHEHSYARSHLLSNFETQKIASESNTLNVKPGQSFVAVSGLGGESRRKWYKKSNQNPWWAATAARDVNVNYGALLCTFNKNRKLGSAHCKFVDIDDTVWDNFWIKSEPGTSARSTESFHKIRRVQLGLSGEKDIVSLDCVSGTVQCGSNRLVLSNSTTSFIHLLRYNIPANLVNLKNGDKIKSARLEVMGAHSMRWTPRKGGAQDKFTSLLSEVQISAVDASSFRHFFDDVCTEDDTNQFAMLNGSNTCPLFPSATVSWTSEQEDWEAGEVWVSPNLASIVSTMISTAGDLVIVLRGTSTFEDQEFRAIIGADRVIGTCASPTLSIEIENLQ